jgi:hypothetical protein
MREIFQNFEVNSEPRWKLVITLLLASLAFHATVVASVLFIPGIRDSINIVGLLSKTRYVDRAYTKTEIGEDVRLVELANKFHYPEGYFATDALNNGASQPGVDPFAPKVIEQNQPEKPFELPAASPSPSPSVNPETSPAPSPSPSTSPGAAAVAENSATPQLDPAKADQELDKIAEENSVVRPTDNEVNTRPLKDWLARANSLKEKGQLDLTSKVEITIEANLTKECKLGDPKVIQKSGDSRLLEVAKDMVSAIGDSGMLSFLRDPKKVQDPAQFTCDEFPLQLSIKLDQNEVIARVESQAESPERAAEMAKGYSGLLAVGQFLKRGHDEELLYKSTKVTSEGKQILVNFSMPRQTASEMLKKQLPAG